MRAIFTDQAPVPAGHYSQAIEHNGLVFVSGQLPVQPDRSTTEPGTIEEQTALALANVEAILKAANSDRGHVLKATLYVSDIALWSRVNVVYSEFFGAHRPARAVVPTRDLHHDYLIEIEVVAKVKD